jgi:methyl-CpG-binding domain protein 4
MKKNYSPYKLLQEIYYPNEWKMFVCVIMLNQTSGTQVHQVIKDLFRRYPNAKSMANAKRKDVIGIIRLCGLYNKRSDTLIRMSQEYLWKSWDDPKQLHGIGTYGQESWRIFYGGEVFTPQDKELKKYMEWKRSFL